MERERPAWMVPIQYNEDRFVEPKEKPLGEQMIEGMSKFCDDLEERDGRDVEEILNRPDREREEREYECTDTTPINYKKGEHNEEFGVDEAEFDEPDNNPVPYDNGPNDDEFGDYDEDDLEPIDDDESIED